ncbi:hypothetical protein BD626DRAFT_505838 [Schizophyllum amplum]|uniref:Uncharacterized protein n=1 Tax=Schizophyllum amplum TaxID=97359 RepID=A0A550C5Z2_9AGAR|nr:hypothetical protein BD626DRAFT_505838 [Auriculariopsis ampla]
MLGLPSLGAVGRRVPAVAIALVVASSASAFSFNIDTASPKSCEDFTVSWSDAQAPYFLLLTPPFGSPRNYSLDSGETSFTTQLPFPSAQQFVATMIDNTGAGVSSDVLSTGDSSSSCDTNDAGTDFTFELNSALQQCRPYTFSNYGGASKPVTIYGIIPLGDLVTINPGDNANSYEWTADVEAGTPIVFVMFDSEGKQGGASDQLKIGASDDSSCLSSDSPSTTTTATPSATSSSGSSKGGASIGAIAGTVIGGLIFLAVAMTLGLFFLRKRARARQPWEPKKRRQSLAVIEVDPPSYDRHQGEFMPSGGQYDADPFVMPPPASHHPNSNVSASDMNHATAHARTLSMTSAPMSSSTSKAALAMSSPTSSRYAPSRFILHTDVEDVEPMPNADGVIELPPQYTERRRRTSDANTNANSSTNLLSLRDRDSGHMPNTPSTTGSGWPASSSGSGWPASGPS